MDSVDQMSSASQDSDETAATFSERFVQVDGTQIRYLEAGRGNPVIVLDTGGALGQSRLCNLLAQQFRVIIFDIPGRKGSSSADSTATRDLSHMLARGAGGIGLERYALVGIAAATPIALWHSIDAPARIDSMVLVSPAALSASEGPIVTDFDHRLESRLADIKLTTLVLLGTKDQIVPPETGRRYAQAIPKCYYVLVYDAGHGLEAERPDVLFATISDFLERREGFVVNRKSTVLNP